MIKSSLFTAHLLKSHAPASAGHLDSRRKSCRAGNRNELTNSLKIDIFDGIADTSDPGVHPGVPCRYFESGPERGRDDQTLDALRGRICPENSITCCLKTFNP